MASATSSMNDSSRAASRSVLNVRLSILDGDVGEALLDVAIRLAPCASAAPVR